MGLDFSSLQIKFEVVEDYAIENVATCHCDEEIKVTN